MTNESSKSRSTPLRDLHLTAWRHFITVHAVTIEAINRELVAADCVPLHWYDVLIELFEAPERRLRMHELAQKVVLSRSGLTRLVDRLENAKLLARQPDPTDRRGSYAVLTRAGVRALRAAWPVYAAAIETYFAQHLSDAEAETMTAAFNRILATTQANSEA